MISSVELLRSDIESLERLLAERKQQLVAVSSLEHGFEWELLSERVALLRDPEQRFGWVVVGYLGFSTKRDAEVCVQEMRRQALGASFEIRRSQRLMACKWEIKAIEVQPDVLRHLAMKQAA